MHEPQCKAVRFDNKAKRYLNHKKDRLRPMSFCMEHAIEIHSFFRSNLKCCRAIDLINKEKVTFKQKKNPYWEQLTLQTAKELTTYFVLFLVVIGIIHERLAYFLSDDFRKSY